jgi:2-oxoglutarate dehydrogenase E1 component
MMEFWRSNSFLYGGNAAYLEELYDNFLENPDAVPEPWRSTFAAYQSGDGGQADINHSRIIQALVDQARAPRGQSAGPGTADARQIAVLQLIEAYRAYGVRRAKLDPLSRLEPPATPELEPANYGLGEADMEAVLSTGDFAGGRMLPLRDIVGLLQATYCGSIGAEYVFMGQAEQKRWIAARLEADSMRSKPDPALRLRTLEKITAAETLERYLHTRYVGQKRFSLEGGETMIAILDQMIRGCAERGSEVAVIGMAHRGRLNVLINTVGKVPADLFDEFEGKHHHDLPSGDVKYHQGFSADVSTPAGPMHLALTFNPSHLEIVNPVVEGSVRARQDHVKDTEGRQIVPILIHGDAAFAGQGVVMETLNLSQTRGYATGGTLHIIVNNQIGFTTSDPRDRGSTVYCTDVAKMVDAPILHVNADDPDAVIRVVELALDFRYTFHRDVVIDMVCFRKLGHNEQDEPMVTQPLMYRKIAQHPGTRALYAQRLVADGLIGADAPDAMVEAYKAAMDAGNTVVELAPPNARQKHAVNWLPFIRKTPWHQPTDTSVPATELKRLADRLVDVPNGFKLHGRVEKIVGDRRAMGNGELPLDWGMAENLAYASLVSQGYSVRLSGQDCGRGTFFHRHAVLHDQNREDWRTGAWVPLQHIAPNQSDFTVIDSVLSEEAVLGFEYGYATFQPDALVIWEGQFGDFANGAQVVIDQFIASGETKWGRLCGLTMMLPHGYEGQGPEHSSGRLERYLQLCAEYNIQVVVPSTPAQMFHVLRRQMLRPYRRPLILFTPKSLLRHKESTSSLDDLSRGVFQPVIAETDELDAAKVKRVVACSGKIYFELRAARRERKIKDVAILRVEQLYPFPHEAFAAELARFPKATEVFWCQEEPRNQGAWHRIQHYLTKNLRAGQTLGEALRESSASPAVGYASKHAEQQRAVIDTALTV